MSKCDHQRVAYLQYGLLGFVCTKCGQDMNLHKPIEQVVKPLVRLLKSFLPKSTTRPLNMVTQPIVLVHRSKPCNSQLN